MRSKQLFMHELKDLYDLVRGIDDNQKTQAIKNLEKDLEKDFGHLYQEGIDEEERTETDQEAKADYDALSAGLEAMACSS